MLMLLTLQPPLTLLLLLQPSRGTVDDQHLALPIIFNETAVREQGIYHNSHSLGSLSSLVMQDFDHQQYVDKMGGLPWPSQSSTHEYAKR